MATVTGGNAAASCYLLLDGRSIPMQPLAAVTGGNAAASCYLLLDGRANWSWKLAAMAALDRSTSSNDLDRWPRLG